MAQAIEAHGRCSVALDEREGVDAVASRFADLVTLECHVAVRLDRAGQRQAGAEQDGRPIHGMKAQNALADQVFARAARRLPVARKVAVRRWESERREVARERVEPNVNHLRWVARHGDAPSSGPVPAPRHAEVREAGPHEAERLVQALTWLHAEATALQRGQDGLAVAREPKEPVRLLDELGRFAVLRTTTVAKLRRLQEGLAACAVQAHVWLGVEIAGFRAAPPQLEHRWRV